MPRCPFLYGRVFPSQWAVVGEQQSIDGLCEGVALATIDRLLAGSEGVEAGKSSQANPSVGYDLWFTIRE